MLDQPLVTIGIPTYNRAVLLRRAIESALRQNYENIEVIVSDNASTDETEKLCQVYCKQDGRLKYIRQPNNLGATGNFNAVRKHAAGKFFMWLADDDWIDVAYVSSCVRELMLNPAVAIVSGHSKYFQDERRIFDDKVLDFLQDSWWERILKYYWRVEGNGIMYGLMRTTVAQQVEMRNTMGGDWLLMARIVSVGKAKGLSEIVLYRELGGASASLQNIAKSLGLPKIQGLFPMTSIAISAWQDIAAYKSQPYLQKLVVGGMAFAVIMLKPARNCFLAFALQRLV